MTIKRRRAVSTKPSPSRQQLAEQRYNDDVRQKPKYHDGTPRKAFAELDDVAQWSWGRP